jgi:coenzyme F420-reducing hydrogenase gamma subunit
MKVPRYGRDDEGNTEEYLGAIVLQDGKAHSRAKRTLRASSLQPSIQDKSKECDGSLVNVAHCPEMAMRCRPCANDIKRVEKR